MSDDVVNLLLIGLDVCECGAPFCRECGTHTERVQDVQLGWDVPGWLCPCGWAVTDIQGPPTLDLN